MANIVLLDGGMGQELIARSANPPSPLWSANVMMNEPDIVEAVHAEYVAAGAKVLTLNAYSVTPERLGRDGNEEMFQPLQDRAIELAKKAKAVVDSVASFPAWNQREDIKAELQVNLILLLAEYGYPPVANDDAYKEILEQAENFKRNASS